MSRIPSVPTLEYKKLYDPRKYMKICGSSHQVAHYLELGKKAFPVSGTKVMQCVVKWSQSVGVTNMKENN